MRIEDNSPTNVYRSGTAGSVSGVDSHSRGGGASGPEPAGSDSAQLSNAANLVTLARQVSSPDRQARVSGVIAQVRSGQYQVDPPQVGRALVQGHLSG
ncbi:MAG: flagellar biosynthesis anti-sigma factor FlgM [Bryobacteraceae bacterium]